MRNLFLLLLLFISFVAGAQEFPRDTIKNSGSSTKRINLVYLGDGYTAGEQNVFISDLQTVNQQLFLASPFKEYANYFNVYAVRVPSNQSGAKHPKTAPDCGSQPVENPDTYFGSTFDVGNIHRLIVPMQGARIQSVLASNYPNYHQMMMIVNTSYYGGSGGTYATATKNASSAEIAIHELGHSFAGLADEYWAGPQYATEKPNMTATADPTQVKWKNWVGTNNVGVFPYSGSASWFRPVQSSRCKMEVLGVSFCSVCKETIVERIHGLVQPIDGYFPANASSINPSGDVGFKLNLVQPNPNTLKVVWKLNGNVIHNNVDTITVMQNAIAAGNHVISATVTDTTEITRANNHISAHAYTVQWNASIVSGISDPQLSSIKLKAYPNPFVNELNINYELSKLSEVKIELVNLLGQTLITKEFKKQAAGSHSTTLDARAKGLTNGIYFLVFTVNGEKIVQEKVRIEQ